ATPEDLEALGKAINKESGLENEIRVKIENVGARERKLENLRSLPGWLATLGRDLLAEDGRIDKDKLLDTLCLDRDKRDKEDEIRTYVSLMTIHAAKGLEFPAVFVTGLEEEQLPHRNSIGDPRAICEERR